MAASAIAGVGCDRRAKGTRDGSADVDEAAAPGRRPSEGGAPGPGAPCGELAGRAYADARDAFACVLALDPRVLGIGEVHPPRAAVVRSAAARFTDELLPLLAGRASDLLLELMQPPAGCADAAARARAAEAPVTTRQSPAAQSEYVTMGERARALGIVPDVLRPGCADVAAIGAAEGDADAMIDTALSAIARLARAQARRAMARDDATDADRGKMIVLYGGALHNDLAPPRGDASTDPRWSYGPDLDAATGGRFVALDLVVPEFTGDDATWRSLPWWPAYERARDRAAPGPGGHGPLEAGGQSLGGTGRPPDAPSPALLLRTGTESFVLVLSGERPGR